MLTTKSVALALSALSLMFTSSVAAATPDKPADERSRTSSEAVVRPSDRRTVEPAPAGTSAGGGTLSNGENPGEVEAEVQLPNGTILTGDHCTITEGQAHCWDD